MASTSYAATSDFDDADMRAVNRSKWTREEDDKLRRIIGKLRDKGLNECQFSLFLRLDNFVF